MNTHNKNFQPWGLQVLGLKTNTAIAMLGLWISIGIMIGGVLAGHLHKVGDLGMTRMYGALLAVVLGLLFVVHTQGMAVAGLITAGFFAGLFLIPLNAALQAESDGSKLGKTIAVQNLTDNVGMCVAAGFVLLASHSGVTPGCVFLILGIVVLAANALQSFSKR